VIFDQSEFRIRCEWGLRGLTKLAPVSDVVIIVDVLSFTTSLDIAVSREAVVFPYKETGEPAAAYAAAIGAEIASNERGTGFSLSPTSLQRLPRGYRLLLPSPNGARLCFSADHPIVLAACLRNASAIAQTAARLGGTVAVIPAGETWESGDLRPAFEDLLGAGAVIAALRGTKSPEAELALAAFEHFRANLSDSLYHSSSGKELISRGFAEDVTLAAQCNVSTHVPRLVNRAFIDSSLETA